MKHNVGPTERYVRIGLGVAAAISALTLSKRRWLSALLGSLAASGIETGLSRYCPMNELLGINNFTSKRKSRSTKLKQAA